MNVRKGRKSVDGQLRMGANLTEEELIALKSASMSGDDILDNLDELNEEISELGENMNTLPKTKVPRTRKPVRKEEIFSDQPSLDDELDALNQELDQQDTVTEETFEEEEEVVEEGDDLKSQIKTLLKETKGAPTEKQINILKRKFGQNSIYCIAMGEGDVYIYTHLKRGQWKKIQEIMSKIQAAGASHGNDPEDALKEKVLQYCVLWPKPLSVEFFYNSRAGVVDAIYQSILLNSYFLTPQQTMMLTTQL